MSDRVDRVCAHRSRSLKSVERDGKKNIKKTNEWTTRRPCSRGGPGGTRGGATAPQRAELDEGAGQRGEARGEQTPHIGLGREGGGDRRSCYRSPLSPPPRAQKKTPGEKPPN